MRTLTLFKFGSGSGTVRSLGAGIDCGRNCGGQSHDYDRLAQVDLVAMPAADSYFAGWSGDGNNISLPGQDSVVRHVGMWNDRAVNATFELGAWVKPDLVVKDLVFNDGSPRIELVVKNIGAKPSAASIVRLRLQQLRVIVIHGMEREDRIPGDTEVVDLPVPKLAPGKRHSTGHSYTLVPTATRMHVWALADAGSSVNESTETNNQGHIVGNLRGHFYC